MRSTPKRLEALAYHEAGHALMAWKYGIPPGGVSLPAALDDPADPMDAKGPEEHRNPVADFELNFDGSDEVRLEAERAIMICFAGPLAQQHFDPQEWNQRDGLRDFQKAAEFLVPICSSKEEIEAYSHLLEVRARSYIESEPVWRMISALAEALLRKRHLTGPEIRELIEPTLLDD